MTKILVVEDEKDVREYLQSALKLEGFEVIAIEDGERLLEYVNSFRPNIILLDQILPKVSGVEVLRRLREDPHHGRTPVIMVTGLCGEEEKVAALNVGADDYVTKPFYPKELAARVNAVLRRVSETASTPAQRLEFRDLIVDFKSHRVTMQGHDVPLTLTEFKILSELLKQKGEVLSRDRLRQTALGNLNVTDRTIDVHMASLRKKLEQHANDIQTVRGVGYRFASE